MTKFSLKLHRCFRDDNGKFYNSHLKNKSVKLGEKCTYESTGLDGQHCARMIWGYMYIGSSFELDEVLPCKLLEDFIN